MRANVNNNARNGVINKFNSTMMKKLLLIAYGVILIMAVALLNGGCRPNNEEQKTITTPIEITFKPVVDAAELKLGEFYNNAFNEAYRVSQFKFYLHKFELLDTELNKSFPLNVNDHYLIDAADAGSKTIALNAPASIKFNRIAFVVGVDSMRNVSGAQTGTLDPAKGMFWTWNSGYIMAKLEGSSPVSNQPNQAFEYHIGGFKGADNVLQRIELSLPQTTSTVPSGKIIIDVTANANAWFNNPNAIKIAETPISTSPGAKAKAVSENYKKMFAITGVR
jgi:hypothetical protein